MPGPTATAPDIADGFHRAFAGEDQVGRSIYLHATFKHNRPEQRTKRTERGSIHGETHANK